MMGVVIDEERVFCVVRGLINLHQGHVFLFLRDDGLGPFLLLGFVFSCCHLPDSQSGHLALSPCCGEPNQFAHLNVPGCSC